MNKSSDYSSSVKKATNNNRNIILFFLLLLVHPGKTQKVLAQYPLETEGQKILRLYDVSGNGNHGTLVKNSGKETPAIVQSGDFPNGITCINKLTYDDASISIPDIYKGHDFKTKGFTVSFWIYVDNAVAFPPQINIVPSSLILSLPAFSIIQRKIYDQTTGVVDTRFAIYYRIAGTDIQYIEQELPCTTGGWYYIALAKRAQNPLLGIFFYRYDGENFDPTDEHLINARGTKSTPDMDFQPDNTVNGSIMSESFKGRMWNMKFYDTGLSLADINNDKNDSWYLSLKDMNYQRNKYYYINSSSLQYYPFNNSLNDAIHGRSPTDKSGFSFTKDRFGTVNNSLQLTSDGHVTYPSFSLAAGNSPACNVVKGFTVSFWTYIDKPLFPADDPSVPYTDKDIRYQAFSVHDAKFEVIAGINLVRDRLVVKRYIPTNPVRPWELWLWDPVSFQNQPGWYHIIFSQKENAMRIVMFKPDDSQACRLNYFVAQDFMNTPLFSFGHVSENIPGRQFNAIQSLDDFRVYNWAFSEDEAAMLHAFEKIKPQ